MSLVNQFIGISQFLILVVRKVVLDHDVQHGPRIGHSDPGFLGVRGQDFVIFRETAGKDAPDAVSVQLQGTSRERGEGRGGRGGEGIGNEGEDWGRGKGWGQGMR